MLSGSIDIDKKLLEENLRKAVTRQTKRFLNEASNRIITHIQQAIKQALRNSETYDELVHGQLRGHIGFPDGEAESKVEGVIDAIVRNVEVGIAKVVADGRKYYTSVQVTFKTDSIDELESTPDAFVETEKGDSLPWVSWMTVDGSAPLIKGYYIELLHETDRPGIILKYSRSNMALMFKGKASAWFLPPEYQGVPNNNWITRAIEENTQLIEQAIIRAVT